MTHPIRFPHLPQSSWFCMLAGLLAIALNATPSRGQDRGAAVDASKPHVVRTFTHHQITSETRGIIAIQPVLSANGNRIVFGLNSAADGGLPRLAAIDFTGANLSILDEARVLMSPHTNADGSRVVYVTGYNEVRIVNGDGTGRRSLIINTDSGLDCPRLCGDGRVVVFLCGRGMNVRQGDKTQTYIRGIYAINADGVNLRRVAGPDEIARLRGVMPDDVGNPNFGLTYSPGAVDISSDGLHIAFGCWVKGASVLFGCDIDGSNLHVIDQRDSGKGQFVGIALSGDASTVAYRSDTPDQIGVAGFEGKWEKSLLVAGSPDDRRMQWASNVPIYITLDGARVTYMGRHFNADGSGGAFQLLWTHQDGLLRYSEYEQPAADALGRRFAYWTHDPQPSQLATMELNTPLDQLGQAPKISDLVLDPPAFPRLQDGVAVVLSKLSARVAAAAPPAVSSSAFFHGLADEKAAQNGSVGMTDLLDDGKADISGDGKAGDGIFTRRWVAVYADAADGPRTLRVEAQVTGSDNRRHGAVVEIGPYPVVPGSAQPPAPSNTPTIDGTPPPQPTATPGAPGTVANGTTTTTDPPPAGAIDLTGYWKADTGATYYVRQIADKVYWYMDALPAARNTFSGTIAGDTLTGDWVDLPGGQFNNSGTLRIKIDSNDKLTKISDSIPYAAATWTRIAKPPGASTGISGPGATGPGPATPGPGVTTPGVAVGNQQPYDTPAGQAAIEQWIALATSKLNAYDGDKTFNDLKPWGIHAKYGTLTNKKTTSAFAPDNFPRYNNNKYWYIWDHYTTDANGRWSLAEWNAAGVPDLHDYVMKSLKK